MKFKSVVNNKSITLMMLACSMSSCENGVKEETEKPLMQTVPLQRQLSPVETSVQKAITDIEKSEIDSGGDEALKIDIEGMELIRYSKKQYLEDELRLQQEDFKKYLNYLDRMKNNPALNDPQKRKSSQEKHDAVVLYLKKSIIKASANAEIYRVDYYMHAFTKNRTYTQQKTTYLDSSLKKIIANYSFLNN